MNTEVTKQIAGSYLLLFVIMLLNGWSCNGQINKDETAKIKLEDVRESISIKSKHSNLVEKDSLIYNQYIENKKEGLWRTFHENGQLKTEGIYKAGLKEGLHKEWQTDGILLLEGFYVKGKANGLMKWFHEKGHLAGEGNMLNDTRVGNWKICDIQENGFCIEAYFKHGKRDGIWKIYHENAKDKLWKEQTFKEDKMVSEKCWDEKGEKIECN